jgi:hypothetical protein
MNLPGFTAEASLYSSNERFLANHAGAGGTGAQAVIPQLCIGSFNRTFNVGPVSINVSGCAIPPKACVKLCVVGICKSFCVP